jgi:hypothetical protein
VISRVLQFSESYTIVFSMVTANPETHWLTVEEAAVIAKRTPMALRQLRHKGKGPKFRKVDGRLLVSEADLHRWLSGEDEFQSLVRPSRAAQA